MEAHVVGVRVLVRAKRGRDDRLVADVDALDELEEEDPHLSQDLVRRLRGTGRIADRAQVHTRRVQ
jgi:hypothetical protein